MDVEILAAAAVYLFSTYNYYLHVYTQNTSMRKKKVYKKLSFRKKKYSKKRENLNGNIHRPIAPSEEFHFVRMSNNDFEYLIQKIAPIITKRDTRWRETVTVEVKLSLTLKFLSSGDSYGTISDLFNLSIPVVSKTITEVCCAINNILGDMNKIPSNEEEWLALSEGFNFPHCLGALDGKHITLLPSCYTGKEYINHIGTFSIVLISLIDSDYCFSFADIGSEGRLRDDDELKQSTLWQKIVDNTLNLPPSCPLPETNTNLPYVFLGDETFPLHNNVMKPFPSEPGSGTPPRIFNQHLARSRAVVENTFGIMTSVFKIFKKPIPVGAERASMIILSCILLHNFLRKSSTSRDIYSPPGSIDIYSHNELVSPGAWRNKSRTNFISLQSLSAADDASAVETRLDFMNHFYKNLTRN